MNGRFHTRGRTNRLDGQVVSDEQIVWCENGTNKFFDEQVVWNLAVWKDDFLKTICPLRRTSRRQYDLNSHIRRSNGWFSRCEEMGLASQRGFIWSFNMADLRKEEVGEVSEKQSEVLEKEQNVVRRRTNDICTCTCVLWWRLKQQLLHQLVLLSFLIQVVLGYHWPATPEIFV